MKKRKLLSFLLFLCMLFTVMPITAYAGEASILLDVNSASAEETLHGLVVAIDSKYEMVKLLTAGGELIWYDISVVPNDVDVDAGQIVSYNLDDYEELEAIDATNKAIFVDAGSLNIVSGGALEINGTPYDISSNAAVFTYDSAPIGAVDCHYYFAGLGDVTKTGFVMSPSSIYLDDEGNVAALLIPKPFLTAAMPWQYDMADLQKNKKVFYMAYESVSHFHNNRHNI